MALSSVRIGPNPLAAAAIDPTLLALARARPDLAWNPLNDIAVARNAHITNTREQLTAALQGEYDWLEGDISVDDHGRAVLHHPGRDSIDFTLGQWLTVVAASGRGAKLDLKTPHAIAPALDALERSHIPHARIIINIQPWLGSGPALFEIRRRFPTAIINITPRGTARVSDAELGAVQLAARIVGGRVMFPIRQDLMSSRIVAALRPMGLVAAWNAPELTDPQPSDVAHLRALGVNGTIDLRDPESPRQRVLSFVIGAFASALGWNAVQAALESLHVLRPPGIDGTTEATI